MTVNRYDAHGFKNFRKDSRGFLRIPAAPTRAGIFIYKRADGSTVRELRPESEVFKADSLASLEMAPVTVRHPEGAVTPENIKDLGIGRMFGEPHRDGLHVATVTAIEDAAAIARVESGEDRELSCGYECDVTETPGTWQGQRYDAVQSNIVYNHVGLGPAGWGRGGKSVALRIDSADAILVSEPQDKINMAKLHLDGVEFEAPDQTVSAFKREIERKDGETKVQTDRADKAEAERDAGVKDLEKAQDPKARQDAVSARVKLQLDACKVLGKDIKLDGMSDDEIRGAVVAKAEPELKLDGKSGAYIEALYDRAVAGAAERNDGLQSTADLKTKTEDDKDVDPHAARRGRHDSYLKEGK